MLAVDKIFNGDWMMRSELSAEEVVAWGPTGMLYSVVSTDIKPPEEPCRPQGQAPRACH